MRLFDTFLKHPLFAAAGNKWVMQQTRIKLKGKTTSLCCYEKTQQNNHLASSFVRTDVLTALLGKERAPRVVS